MEHVHVHMYGFIHLSCNYTCILGIYMYVCVHVCIHTTIRACINTYIPTQPPTYINTYIPTYLRAYEKTYIRNHTHLILRGPRPLKSGSGSHDKPPSGRTLRLLQRCRKRKACLPASCELLAFGPFYPSARLVACRSTCRSWASVLITFRSVQDSPGGWWVVAQTHLKKQLAAQARVRK